MTAYGRSKLEGEQVVPETRDCAGRSCRPGVVYGPGDRALLPLFRFAARGMLPLVGRAAAAYTFVHVRDVVRAIAAAVDAAAVGEILFVGHPQPVTAREILDAIRLVVGRPAMVIPVPQAITRLAAAGCDLLARVVGRPLPLNRWRYVELSAEGFVCQVDRLRDRLGIVAELDLRAGLADTAAWYRRERLDQTVGPRRLSSVRHVRLSSNFHSLVVSGFSRTVLSRCRLKADTTLRK